MCQCGAQRSNFRKSYFDLLMPNIFQRRLKPDHTSSSRVSKFFFSQDGRFLTSRIDREIVFLIQDAKYVFYYTHHVEVAEYSPIRSERTFGFSELSITAEYATYSTVQINLNIA